MDRQGLLSLLALSALLLCTSLQTASSASPSTGRGRNDLGTPQNWLEQGNVSSNHGNHSYESTPSSPKIQEVTSSSSNNSRVDISTVMYEKSDWEPNWHSEEGESPLCAYKVVEKGIDGQLCFRNTLPNFQCHQAECKTVVSMGNLHANILINGSVLLQWTGKEHSTMSEQDIKTENSTSGQERSGDAGTNATSKGRGGSDTSLGVRHHRQGGYELSCWWNGSYTQFECAGVLLGSSCRDFLLTGLHENIPYRICLHPLARLDQARRADHWNCVDFILLQSGMQDIVIAMTAVGGAICVMLVIICLLVAYITENIMSPTLQHSHSYRTRSHH